MKKLLLLVSLVLLASATVEQAEQMTSRPFLVKLGSVPNAQVVGTVAGRYRCQFSSWWVMKVLFYFGSFVGAEDRSVANSPEYLEMYRILKAAVKLDPYNMDAYYFAQASFTWELGRIKAVNSLLKYGMKYRNWDYQLPFYAGFNAAFFLRDYAEGARLMKIAAERSGSPLFTKLAARYFYQARETELGIVFIKAVLRQTKDENLRKTYSIRLEALQAVHEIESAIVAYRKKYGHSPESLNDLVQSGTLSKIPDDPYGGHFHIVDGNSVVSTSNFAFANRKRGNDIE